MTLIARPTAPSVLRPELDVPKTMPSSCICQDKDLERLRDLMRRGIPQWEASRLLWSPEVAPGVALSPREWVVMFARQSFMAAFPWLKLPTPTEVS